MVQVADVAIGRGGREGEREAPKVPLEDDDTKRHHDHPEHGKGGFTTGEAGVEEGDAGHHEEDQAGADEDEGLVSGLVPLVKVRRGCGQRRDPWSALLRVFRGKAVGTRLLTGITACVFICAVERHRRAYVCVGHGGGIDFVSRITMSCVRSHGPGRRWPAACFPANQERLILYYPGKQHSRSADRL